MRFINLTLSNKVQYVNSKTKEDNWADTSGARAHSEVTEMAYFLLIVVSAGPRTVSLMTQHAARSQGPQG